MIFPNQEELFAEFQDLIDGLDFVDDTACDPNVPDGGDISVEEVTIHKLDATTLTLADLIVELERRGLQPHGFFSDDAKRLQECFDKEHEEYVESKRKELMNAKMMETEQRAERRKKEFMKTVLEEEELEISSNIRLAEWLKLFFAKACPVHCRIDINNISSMTLAKAIWSDSRIISVDVSNMELSDMSGAYLARALRNNATILKYELGGNEFGPKTVKALANSLLTNNTLCFLSLESNSLVKSEGDTEFVEQLSHALSRNLSLTTLSLWRCGIGIEGGRALCKAIASNSTLTILEVGYNNFDSSDVKLIEKQLVRKSIPNIQRNM